MLKIECQLLHILVQYFLVNTYFWMFCEGLYLHTLLVVTFVTKTKVMPFLYPIGWGVPALLVALYAVLRSSRREEKLQKKTTRWIYHCQYVIKHTN
ncbi:hypothetical protein J6590_103495 [Homalodisca vitripennis]|nr:hypothetical protein J6590_103495 [Homalodisca vitripennis]